MALWAKAQQLPNDSIHLHQIRGIYGDHFPIEVRHYLAQFIEEKFCSQVPENTKSESGLTDLFNQLLQEIESKADAFSEATEFFLTKPKLVNAAKMFKEKYASEPNQLFNFIRRHLATEIKILQDAGVDFCETDPMLFLSSSAADISYKLNNIRQRTQTTAQDAKQLEQEQELFALSYHECAKINAHLQQLSTQDATSTLQTQLTLKDLYMQELNHRAVQVIKLLTKINDNFRETYQHLKQLRCKIIDEELVRWKHDQQLAGNGMPFNSNLDQIQGWCENLAELIWLNRQQMKEVDRLKEKLALNLPGVADLSPPILPDINQLLFTLVTSSFIVENQPPQVLKTNIKFPTSVRLLVGGKLNVHMTPPQVKATIISESQAKAVLANSNQMLKGVDTAGEIINNTGTMEYQQITKRLAVNFMNMQLRKIKRPEKKGSESVTDEKFCLFFQSQFSVGGGELVFQVWTLSLPIVVIVHGNQEHHAWATVTWDNAFSEPGRCPFQVPDRVSWDKMKNVLSQKFKWATGRGLTEDHLRFIGEKIFRDNFNEAKNPMVSWSQFCKEPLSERNFTFWEWFFAILKLTKEQLKEAWADGVIMGFVNKVQVENMLLNCQPGTFLLRFSDSAIGGITASWLSDTYEVLSLEPYTAKGSHIRPFFDIIGDLKCLATLYPETPKENCLPKYYKNTNQQKRVKGYVRISIIARCEDYSTKPHKNVTVDQDPVMASVANTNYLDFATTSIASLQPTTLPLFDRMDSTDSAEDYPDSATTSVSSLQPTTMPLFDRKGSTDSTEDYPDSATTSVSSLQATTLSLFGRKDSTDSTADSNIMDDAFFNDILTIAKSWSLFNGGEQVD